MSILAVLPLAAESESGAGVWPYVVAGAALVVLFGAILALLVMGAGREHS